MASVKDTCFLFSLGVEFAAGEVGNMISTNYKVMHAEWWPDFLNYTPQSMDTRNRGLLVHKCQIEQNGPQFLLINRTQQSTKTFRRPRMINHRQDFPPLRVNLLMPHFRSQLAQMNSYTWIGNEPPISFFIT
jgi:hypothetical protein